MDEVNQGRTIDFFPGASADQTRLLALAVDQSNEGIAIVDLNGTLQYVNAAFAGMHGYAPDEILRSGPAAATF